MLRAAVAAEQAGIPTVSLVCEGFERQSLATGRGLGLDGMRLGVLTGHVDSQSTEQMLEHFAAHTVDEVIAGLLDPVDTDAERSTEPNALDVVATGDAAEINRVFLANGWSDGNPIVPPSRRRVEDLLLTTGHDPWRSLGTARPSGRDLTIWSLAVNAVMAGLGPEQFPTLVAMAEVLADDGYGVEHSGNTTGADAIVILDGPGQAEMGFTAGAGAMREGVHANTATGRWLRLVLRNLCGFTSDEHDKATFGNPARPVLVEDMACLAEIGWDPVSARAGFGADDDVVTMARMNSGAIVGSVYGSTPEEILPYLADGLTRTAAWDLTHVYGLGSGHFAPLLVLSPVLARIFGRAGWSLDDLQQALFERARIPASRFERYIGEWSNLTAGRRTLTQLAAEGHVPPAFAESDDPDRAVPIVTESSKFVVAVAGDPNRTNAYVLSNDGPHGWWTSKRIDRDRSTDLECIVP